jgi:methionyl-tRNA formyltransferase
MKKDFYWKALFSQTGSEILEISLRLGRFPDTIITNKNPEDMDKINPVLLEKAFDRFVFVPRIPTVGEYKEAIKHADMVTLHGFLRILPPEICYKYKIYNGHPGLITRYSELKGKDPQAKVWNSKGHAPSRNYHGHVIHEVVPEVDAGKVVSTAEIYEPDIWTRYKTLQDYINALHLLAIDNWVAFLKRYPIVSTKNLW